MNSKTHMVVLELVSQHLDEQKNNGLISKLHEFSVGTVLSMLSCVIFNKSWVDSLTPKFLWFILDIQGSSSVKFDDNWMCLDSPFVFYKWGICCWNGQ